MNTNFKTLLLCWAALAVTPPASADAREVRPLDSAQAAEYNLDPDFYKKVSMVNGMLIATSERVPDAVHHETAWIFENMMETMDPDVARRVRERGVLCIIAAHDEMTSDIPQFQTDKTGPDLAFYNWRQRGFIRTVDDRMVVFFAEEDVMEYEGGMQLESIAVHEFGHVIDFAGLDDDQRQRLTETYEQAQELGLWNDARAAQRFRRVRGDEPVRLLDALVEAFPGRSPALLERCLEAGDILVNGEPSHPGVEVTGDDEVLIMFGGPKQAYAIINRAEYFAEGVQNWFDTNRTMDHDHNHIHTRKQLREYDPGLAAFLEDILGDGEWRFTSPRERAGTGHLADYDPKTAPVVERSEFIENAALDYYDEYWSSFWERLEEKHAEASP